MHGPAFPTTQSNGPYIRVTLMLLFTGILLVTAAMWLRPRTYLPDIIAQVLTGLVPTIAGVLAYMKAQQTHLSVNSRLDAFMKTAAALAKEEGRVEGVASEKLRRAEEKHEEVLKTIINAQPQPGQKGDKGETGETGATGAQGEHG